MMMLVVLGVVLLPVGYAVMLFNGLVRLRNRVKNGFAQIDVQLKRRYDLIPNLVETAKRYLDHERDTLEAVIDARNTAIRRLEGAAADPGDPGAVRDLAKADGALTGVLGRLMAVAEDYPELKGDATMMQLSEELASTENRVAFARQAFNDAVLRYNNACQMFPGNFIAGTFQFQTAEPLEVDAPAERQAPRVSFD